MEATNKVVDTANKPNMAGIRTREAMVSRMDKVTASKVQEDTARAIKHQLQPTVSLKLHMDKPRTHQHHQLQHPVFPIGSQPHPLMDKYITTTRKPGRHSGTSHLECPREV